VGAGDVIHGELLKVPLTTVSWSRAELGREAAELLLNAAERNGNEPRRVVIAPHLVIRESCGGAAVRV
jgi:DNA-binding LacI/PurR family transcriptional regulator